VRAHAWSQRHSIAMLARMGRATAGAASGHSGDDASAFLRFDRANRSSTGATRMEEGRSSRGLSCNIKAFKTSFHTETLKSNRNPQKPPKPHQGALLPTQQSRSSAECRKQAAQNPFVFCPPSFCSPPSRHSSPKFDDFLRPTWCWG
jgi:hypothetical protein